MGKGKRINSEQFVEEAIDNIRNDRAIASTLLVELMKLVKLASLISKKEGATSSLSSKEKSDIYELIKENGDD